MHGLFNILGFVGFLTVYWLIPYGFIKDASIEDARERRVEYTWKQELQTVLLALFLGGPLLMFIMYSDCRGLGWTLRVPRNLLKSADRS